MGSALSSTLKESVVWGERDLDSVAPFTDGADDGREGGGYGEHACAIPIELSGEYETACSVPVRATARAAGFDLRAAKSLTLPPASTIGGIGTIVPTGTKLALDSDEIHGRISPDTVLYGDIRGRSSLAKKGIRVFQGTIDADYRGEIGVLAFNDTDEAFEIQAGDRIAQLLIQIALVPAFEKVDDIQAAYTSDRGEGGFGSTGVREVVAPPAVEAKIVVESDGAGAV